MNEKWTKFWLVPPIVEALIWSLPAFIAYFGHLCGWPKARLSGTGPGFHILLVDDNTVAAQHVWLLVESFPHPFIQYALILFAFSLLLNVKHVRVRNRIALLVVLSIPGFWYFLIEIYLFSKIIG